MQHALFKLAGRVYAARKCKGKFNVGAWLSASEVSSSSPSNECMFEQQALILGDGVPKVGSVGYALCTRLSYEEWVSKSVSSTGKAQYDVTGKLDALADRKFAKFTAGFTAKCVALNPAMELAITAYIRKETAKYVASHGKKLKNHAPNFFVELVDTVKSFAHPPQPQ